jgi:hypothetical protein
MQFEMEVPVPGKPGAFPRPQGGNEIVFLNGVVREFAGVIVSVEEEEENPDTMLYRVTCKDYSHWFDHRLVVEDYPSQAADLIVKDIVNRYASASGITFTTASVQPGPVIAQQQFNYVPPSESVKTIADTLEYNWYIDYYKDVHFAVLESFVSPLPDNTLNPDLEASRTLYHDLVLSEDVAQVKNRIYLKDFKTRSPGRVPFNQVGDGVSTWFPLGYEPWSIDPVDITALIDGAPQPVKLDGRDGQVGDGQVGPGVFVCFDNLGVRLNQALPVGAVLSGNFAPKIQMPIVVDDAESQAVMKAREVGTDGVYEHAVQDPSLSAATIDTARLKGQLLVYKYGLPKMVGRFGSYFQGWRAGQCFRLVSTRRMGGLDQKMYVVKVTKSIVRADPAGDNVLHYTVEVSDTPFVV